MKDIKTTLIESKGNCYFRFCVYDDAGVLKVDRSKCIIGQLCKPFIGKCRDGKRSFLYPFTHTQPSKIVQLATNHKGE